MATGGDGRAPSESVGAREMFRKRLFQPEINEDPQTVSQEAGQNNSTGASEVCTHQGGNFASISVTIGKSEVEQILKQMTFTRSETQHLIALLHSRTIEESPSPVLRLEASSASGSMKRHKHGDDRDNFHASVVASPQYPMTMENLPHKLLLNIFFRLLAKQLAQMRSVSKSWNALLSHTCFVKSHLHHSLRHNDQILLVFSDEEDESEIFTTHLSRCPQLKLANFIKLPLNPRRPKYTDGITVIGSINGLICSSYGDSVIQIWNPSLSAVLTLPPYSIPFHDYDRTKIYFRFGYDPKTNDYKVVKLAGLPGQPAYVIRRWLQVEIYSMRRGSWELITERIPSHITSIYTDDGVCADGHGGYLHCLACTNGKFIQDRILAFDLGSETFREMSLPHFIPHPNPAKYLGVLNRKLCVMSWIRDENGACEVWVMEEYGVPESWVKRHVVSKFTFETYPYGFTSYNQLLFHHNSCLSLYDPIAKREKFIENFCQENFRPQKIVEYVDSLIWIAPVEREMVDGGLEN